LLVAALVALTIFALVSIVQSHRDEVRHLPRWLWFVVVLILPGVGLIAWWIFGRPWSDGPGDGPGDAPARPRAPDDDSDFLRSL
jgi:drug/metabolite transporter (DMT)-like permease